MINKKKIACFALASALAIPGVFALSGCEVDHKHAYISDPFYEVITEGETKIVRSWHECFCGAEDIHKNVDNAVIVTPTTVQDALDGRIVLRNGEYVVGEKQDGETYESINDKIIVFDEGEYNEILHLRPSKETATIYTIYDTLVEGEIDNNTAYKYVRDFTNLTFAGTENAVFNQLFYVKTGQVTSNDEFLKDKFIDPIKNSSEFGKYDSLISMDSITFTRLNFNGENGRIVISYGDSNCTIDEITVQSCKFITETPDTSSKYSQYNASSYLVAHKNGVFGTINYINNKVDGHYQGVYTQNANEVNVIYNEISNTMHNAIAIKNGSEHFTGIAKVLYNKISNTGYRQIAEDTWIGDRAIRFGKCDNAQIFIENNTIINGLDEANELIKSEVIKTTGNTPVPTFTYTLKNNTHNGILLEDVTETTTSLLVTIDAE